MPFSAFQLQGSLWIPPYLKKLKNEYGDNANQGQLPETALKFASVEEMTSGRTIQMP